MLFYFVVEYFKDESAISLNSYFGFINLITEANNFDFDFLGTSYFKQFFNFYLYFDNHFYFKKYIIDSDFQ